MRYIISSFLLLVIISQNFAQSGEELVVFTSTKNKILLDADIKVLEKLAFSMDMELKLVDADQGAPPEVSFTPSIVFQNSEGRSFFYGRYKNDARLKNFIRTSRMVHKESIENTKHDILVWKIGRASITAPLKLTDLSGSLPEGFDQETFKQEATQYISKGITPFKQEATYKQSPTSRSFYFNLYPYLDDEKCLSISAEIFSQYNCVKPVFQQYAPTLVKGAWKNRASLFEQAGNIIKEKIKEKIKNSTIGDAFAPIESTTPVKTWDALNLSLPSKDKEEKNKIDTAVDIPRKWTVDMPDNLVDPIIIFSFLPPLDSYAGEVKQLKGTLELDEKGGLKNAIGNFDVQISDVTMGAEDFDYEVQNKMLKMGIFPNSSFIFEQITGGEKALVLGNANDIRVKGRFKMLGITIPLEVPARIEPVLNTEGEIRLQVNTAFQLPLFDAFKVLGPDGPSPAKDTLQFYMKFYLKPI